jgi:glucose/arabinose dehydrogenase
MKHDYSRLPLACGLAVLLGGCGDVFTEAAAQTARPGCAADNGGILLLSGFCASVFADQLGHARHVAVAPNGDVYVNTWSSNYNKRTNAPGGYIVALRDANRDGRAETVVRFGTTHEDGKPGGGTGIAVHAGWLYVEVDDEIVRYPLSPDALVPTAEPETILAGMPMDGDHPAHPFAIASDGTMYVNSGSISNACQERDRATESPGLEPCLELATRAGIWRYNAHRPDQTASPHERFATGLRNTVALALRDNKLYAATHGRDQLSGNWPTLFSDAENNEAPAETFARVDEGEDFGWPYCYFDTAKGEHVLAPEYGGDGVRVGDCGSKALPDITFPAHWAPDGMAFSGDAGLPERYRNGAFITFHGSWQRTPLQAGFLVAFVSFKNDTPVGYEVFATGFEGPRRVVDPSHATYRPVGIAVAPDGAIYVTDDKQGRVWRIQAIPPRTR